MKYRKVDYKYELMEDEMFDLDIFDYTIDTPFIALNKDGWMLAKKGYAWNGADWYPDTKAVLGAACGHDAGLQLIGLGLLPMTHKKAVDDLLRRRYYENLKASEHWFQRKFARVLSKTVWIAVRKKGSPNGMVPNPVLECP